MAAWLGSYGPAAFGGDDLPQPSAVIMQYTCLLYTSHDRVQRTESRIDKE